MKTSASFKSEREHRDNIIAGTRKLGIATCEYLAKRTTGETRANYRAVANQLRAQDPKRCADKPKPKKISKPIIPAPSADTFKAILHEIAARSGVSATKILRDNRARAVYIARVAVYHHALAAGLTSEQVGVLTKRDGSSVRHGAKRAPVLARHYPQLAELLVGFDPDAWKRLAA